MLERAGTAPAPGDSRSGDARAPAMGARWTEPSALETILIVRPIRDADGVLLDGEIEFANDAWIRAFGDGAGSPAGRRISAFYPPGDDVRRDAFVAAADHGRSLRLVLPHPDHPDRFGELRIVPLDGRVLFTSHDATDAVRAERALEDSERRYRELVEQVFDGVIVLRPDGSVESINGRVAEMLGVADGSIERLLALQQSAIVQATPGERADAREQLARGEVVTGDAVVTRADGASIVVEQRARLRDDGCMVIMIRDVTAARAADEAQHERLATEARGEALTQLAGGVAHDLNNHLTSILGYADLALADHGSPEQLANDLRQIVAASERAQEVTRRLLAFGGRSLLRPRAVDLGEVLASLEPSLRHVAGNRLALILGPAPNLPLVRVDATMLERALVALVENARDAMQGRGVLGITTGMCTLDDDPGGDSWACLRIEDTGVGMDASQLARAFEPFSEGRTGGLGLPMVQGFMHQSGGHLRISSTPGAGTVVSLFLPFAEQSAGAEVGADAGASTSTAAPTLATTATVVATDAHADETRPGAGVPPVVLIVDDEQLIRDLAVRVLARAGFETVTAGSGEEALRIAADDGRRIDLLFTDVVMPGMHGIALANVLRRQRPGIRVLITSGYGQDEVDREAVAGAASFLPKPYAPQDLLTAVRGVLDRAAG